MYGGSNVAWLYHVVGLCEPNRFVMNVQGGVLNVFIFYFFIFLHSGKTHQIVCTRFSKGENKYSCKVYVSTCMCVCGWCVYLYEDMTSEGMMEDRVIRQSVISINRLRAFNIGHIICVRRNGGFWCDRVLTSAAASFNPIQYIISPFATKARCKTFSKRRDKPHRTYIYVSICYGVYA